MFNIFKKKHTPKVTYFTSESVSPGHPDKLCDTVADAIKDYIISKDPTARVAVEVMVTTNFMILCGEVSTSIKKVPYTSIARETVKLIGYTHEHEGFSYRTFEIVNKIHKQSPDIALGTTEDAMGAGDQGIILGYACNETRDNIPLSWALARTITSESILTANSKGSILRPDAKSQVTIKYVDGKVAGIDTIVFSCSYEKGKKDEALSIMKDILDTSVSEYGYALSDVRRILMNPTGEFTIYGPDGDTGLTGRKLVVDQYGGHSAVGGGTMSGKDPSKVDNSAALIARYIANNIVAAGISDKCQVQLSYAIGVTQPVSVNLEFFGTESPKFINRDDLENWILHNVDCSPKGIIDKLDLRKEQDLWCYANMSAFGWFGSHDYSLYEDYDFEPAWEKTDLVLKLSSKFIKK